jgi:hypothetical protein
MNDKPNPFLKLMADLKADRSKAGQTEKPNPLIEAKKISDSVAKPLTAPAVSATPISPTASEKPTLPQLTPQAQRLLGAAPTPKSADDFIKPESALATSDLQELARIDTEKMEPQTDRKPNLLVKANELNRKLTLDSTSSVRALCDQIDELIPKQAGSALEGPPLIHIRNYVQTLMVTLKQRPEFAEAIIDNDIRNVIKFIRATRQEALALREVKTVKKEVKAAKKASGASEAKKAAAFDSAFSKVMFGLPPGMKGGS